MQWRNRIAHKFRSRTPTTPTDLRYQLVKLRLSGLDETDHEYDERSVAVTAFGLLVHGVQLGNLGDDDPVIQLQLVDRKTGKVIKYVDIEPPETVWF